MYDLALYGSHPGPGIQTSILWGPTVSSTSVGVTLCVFTSLSTVTFAPLGKEVIFRWPRCPCAKDCPAQSAIPTRLNRTGRNVLISVSSRGTKSASLAL